MAHISQKRVRDDVLLRLHKQFSDVLLSLRNSQRGAAFIDELLTDTEKIMLAKRLAILMMLFEEVPHSVIAQVLGTTRATVWKYAQKLDRGGFVYMVYVFRRRKDREEFWKTLCKLSRGGLPPYAGRGRWSYLYKLQKNRYS